MHIFNSISKLKLIFNTYDKFSVKNKQNVKPFMTFQLPRRIVIKIETCLYVINLKKSLNQAK